MQGPDGLSVLQEAVKDAGEGLISQEAAYAHELLYLELGVLGTTALL